MQKGKKIYFASDFHLGAHAALSSKERELLVVDWLDSIKADAEAIYLLGDIFDHWFEYKTVIPTGYSNFIGKLAELRREEVPIFFFTGNHDMWMFDYFEKEFGIPIFRKPLIKTFSGKRFYLMHGDALPTDSFLNRLMKTTFSNQFLQWAFARLHPNLAIGLMRYFSSRSRMAHEENDKLFILEQEFMITYSNQLLATQPDLDYIISGHRHLPVDYMLENKKTRHINLGDWIYHFSYGVFDGASFQLKFFKDEFTIHPSV